MPMSTGTKRILAVVVVVVIVAAGVGVYLLITPSGPQYVVPGAPSGISSSQVLKVGVLDDMTDVTGKGSYQGSWLAAYEINKAGGVVVNGTHYYFGLITEDTSEASPTLDTSKGVAAAQKIISVDGAQFLTGGFRTESLLAYLDTVVNAKILMIGTGSSADNFTQKVLDNYAKYKYFFRNQPINSSSLGASLFTELAFLRAYLSVALNRTVHKWAILRENLDWTKALDGALKAYMGFYGWDAAPTHDIAFSYPATATDFAGYMSTIKSDGAQFIIPIISASGGVLMDEEYNATQPNALICGINVPSQLDTFYNDTGKTANYEIVLQTLVRTNRTIYTIPFWDHYKGNWTSSPIYTSVGGYDAIKMLQWAINSTQSFNSDTLVTALETRTRAHPFVGVAGVAGFTRSHDLWYGLGFATPIFAQWQPGGLKPAITSGGLLYPNSIVTGALMLPPWGIA